MWYVIYDYHDWRDGQLFGADVEFSHIGFIRRLFGVGGTYRGASQSSVVCALQEATVSGDDNVSHVGGHLVDTSRTSILFLYCT